MNIPFQSPKSNNCPQHHNTNAEDRPKHLEKITWQLLCHLCCTGREDTQREREAPPSHIEREFTHLGYTTYGQEEPNQCKSPHDCCRQPTYDVEDLAAVDGGSGSSGGRGKKRKSMREWEEGHGDFAQLLDCKAALAEGPEGEEDGDDDFARGEGVER